MSESLFESSSSESPTRIIDSSMYGSCSASSSQNLSSNLFCTSGADLGGGGGFGG